MAFPTITVRVAFASAPFAGTPSWTEITDDVQEYEVRRGRMHDLDRMQAGNCTVALLNIDGNYWPDNAGGSYYPNVLPAKRVNLRADYGGTIHDLFTGFADQWQPRYRLPGVPTNAAVVELKATDLTRNLACLELNGTAGYSEESSDLRIDNVLDDLGWPAADRDLSTGQSTIKATGALENVNALSHIHDVEDAELGYMFVAGDGDVQWHDRHARLKGDYLVAQAIFGDDAGEMLYHDAELSFDDTHIYNDVRFTRVGGTEQVAEDATSRTDYGKRSKVNENMLTTTDGVTLSLAQYLMVRYKTPALRLRSITIRPQRDEANLFPKVLSYDIGTRITLRLNDAAIDRDYFIEGIRHRWKPLFWETTWWLSDADSQEYWILGTSQLGTGTRLAV